MYGQDKFDHVTKWNKVLRKENKIPNKQVNGRDNIE